MDIYVALYEEPAMRESRADVLGAWSTAEAARADCQRFEDEDAELGDTPKHQLQWVDDSAESADGNGAYRVSLIALDEPYT